MAVAKASNQKPHYYFFLFFVYDTPLIPNGASCFRGRVKKLSMYLYVQVG